jgi:hypothetical protein
MHPAGNVYSGVWQDGAVEVPGDKEWYELQATAGHTYQIETDPQTLDDTIMDLVGTDRATVIIENDDDERDGHEEIYTSYIEWTCPSDGLYYIAVRGYGSSTGTFAFRVTDPAGGGALGGGDGGDPCSGGSTLGGREQRGAVAFQPSSGYEDMAVCSWEIACAEGTPHVQFTALDTEADHDGVLIFDGTVESRQLDNLSGNLDDLGTTEFQASGSTLTVEFVSAEDTSRGGFAFDFSCE